MAFNLYDVSVPVTIRFLGHVKHWMNVAREHLAKTGAAESTLTEARLVADMRPFTFQVYSACNIAKFLTIRVAGVENVVQEDNEKTFADLDARIDATIKILEGVKREAFDGTEEREVEFHGMKFTGLTYVINIALPDFYFHVTTAYDILRANGVNVGKRDFLAGNGNSITQQKT